MKLWTFVFLVSTARSARILAWFSCPAVSHQSVFQPIWKELSLRGHEVTVITPNPLNDNKLINLTEIDIGFTYQLWKTIDISNMRRELSSAFRTLYYFHKVHEESIRMTMESGLADAILNKPESYFDLIIIEAHTPILFGLQHKFKTPLVAISSLGFFNHLNNLIGNSIHPFLYPDFVSELRAPLSVMEKLDSIYLTIGNYFMNLFIISPNANKIAKLYFGEDMPYIEDLMRKTSLVFENINPIFADRKPLVPNSMQFFHTISNRTTPLEQELKQILDSSKKGIIYFSLGTNVRFDHVEDDMKKTILQALGDLPYTVICKWESESVPNQPKNVYLRKWLPQQALLAHPNIKLFVTQGGLQSSEEAIINAIPLVVIPFLGDQPLNAKILTANGMAETILPRNLKKEILTETILKVVKDERYKTKAKEVRDIFLDQPQSGIDKVIWWCEYVIRHKGAKHLRSPAADISLFEYFMLDIVGLVILSLMFAYQTTRLFIKLLSFIYKRKYGSDGFSKEKKRS